MPRPETIPVAGSIVTIPGGVHDHVPPGYASANVSVEPEHTPGHPVMGGMAGMPVTTYTGLVTVVVPQELVTE